MAQVVKPRIGMVVRVFPQGAQTDHGDRSFYPALITGIRPGQVLDLVAFHHADFALVVGNNPCCREFIGIVHRDAIRVGDEHLHTFWDWQPVGTRQPEKR